MLHTDIGIRPRMSKATSRIMSIRNSPSSQSTNDDENRCDEDDDGLYGRAITASILCAYTPRSEAAIVSAARGALCDGLGIFSASSARIRLAENQT